MRIRSLIEFDKEDMRRLGIELNPADDLTPADLGRYYDLVWDEITRLGYISLEKLSAEGDKLVAIASPPRKATAAAELPAGQVQAAAPALVPIQTQQEEVKEVVAPAAHPF